MPGVTSCSTELALDQIKRQVGKIWAKTGSLDRAHYRDAIGDAIKVMIDHRARCGVETASGSDYISLALSVNRVVLEHISELARDQSEANITAPLEPVLKQVRRVWSKTGSVELSTYDREVARVGQILRAELDRQVRGGFTDKADQRYRVVGLTAKSVIVDHLASLERDKRAGECNSQCAN